MSYEYLYCSCCCYLPKPCWRSKSLTAFVVKENDLIAEGIAYDPVANIFYLGSIQKQKIVKITAKGDVSDFVTSAQDGIKAVLGMKVDTQGRFWACNNTPESDTVSKESNIHVYDRSGSSWHASP